MPRVIECDKCGQQAEIKVHKGGLLMGDHVEYPDNWSMMGRKINGKVEEIVLCPKCDDLLWSFTCRWTNKYVKIEVTGTATGEEKK